MYDNYLISNLNESKNLIVDINKSNNNFCNECFDGNDLNKLKNNCTLDNRKLIYKPKYQIPKDYYIIPIFTFLCCLGLIFQKCY